MSKAITNIKKLYKQMNETKILHFHEYFQIFRGVEPKILYFAFILIKSKISSHKPKIVTI